MAETTEIAHPSRRKTIWMRGLYMLIVFLLLELARAVLAVITLVQFIWMLVKGDKNTELSGFGRSLGRWYRAAVEFQTGETDEKPFPWQGWPSDKAE